MKKFIPILLVLAMLLVGCGKAEKTEINETTIPPTETIAETTPVEETEPYVEPVITQQDMAAVSLPVVEEAATNDDGKEIFTYHGQSMIMVLPDPDVASKITVDFLTRQDSFRQTAESIKASAPTDTAYPYFYQALYAPTRIDMNVLSLAGTASNWTGGAHSNHTCIYANYNMVTGDPLTLGSVLAHANQAKVLGELVVEAIAKMPEELGIWEDYAAMITERFAGDVSSDGDWFFDHKGMSFSFAPYEIAPYASGVITVTIPYEELIGVIDDAYFPVEQDITNGELSATMFSEATADDFTQIAEVIYEEDAPTMLLYTDSIVTNVTIQIDNQYTVFATTALTPGDAIMLQADLQNHVVKVHFHTAEQDFDRYLVMENDTIQFTEEQPQIS